MENNELLVAYCGLYCGSCHGYSGQVADLARDLRKALRESKYKNFAYYISETNFGKVYKGYDTCYEVLGAMVKFRCKKGCRQGGGNPYCKIRICCNKQNFQGCWECEIFENCDKLSFLEAVHQDAHLKNLRIIKKKGIEAFLKGKINW